MADVMPDRREENSSRDKRLPNGTITFLFTDIEGSSRMWEADPAAARSALATHDKLVISGVEEVGGIVVKSRGEGDSHFAVFTNAGAAIKAAAAIQRALEAQEWLTEKPLRVRMALHTGEAELRMGDYFGTAVNRAARIRSAASGGQVLLSQATAELVRDRLPRDVVLRDLGSHRLKDLNRPEQIYQLDITGLPTEFPALKSLNRKRHNLPAQSTSFIGRAQEIAQINALLEQDTARLVMLTGPGGIGKTNLTLQVGRNVLEQFPDGVWLVELAPIADPDLVPKTAAAALGLRELPNQPVLEMMVEHLGDKECLLILDNCEHLVNAAARFVQTVIQACPKVKILASSREALGMYGEIPYRVPPLSFPEGHHLPPLEMWKKYDALRLFVERATAVLPAFQVTDGNFAPLVKICRRLDGIPLALELAAARVNILTIGQIANRLDDRFRLLTGGSRTALPRQQTLRALIDWSWDLLSEEEQVLLGRLSVFAGGMDLEAVEAVCAGDNLDIYDLLDLLGDLVNKSLVIAQREQGQATR
jgi:predicted ATPase/class 3 adenylate cyclase